MQKSKNLICFAMLLLAKDYVTPGYFNEKHGQLYIGYKGATRMSDVYNDLIETGFKFVYRKDDKKPYQYLANFETLKTSWQKLPTGYKEIYQQFMVK